MRTICTPIQGHGNSTAHSKAREEARLVMTAVSQASTTVSVASPRGRRSPLPPRAGFTTEDRNRVAHPRSFVSQHLAESAYRHRIAG